MADYNVDSNHMNISSSQSPEVSEPFWDEPILVAFDVRSEEHSSRGNVELSVRNNRSYSS